MARFIYSERLMMQWAMQAFSLSPFPDTRFPPSPYYRFLRILAANIHPNLSVELGCGGCGASLNLAIGWNMGTVIGVDSFPSGFSREPCTENIRFVQEKFNNFVFLEMDSVKAASFVFDNYGQVDILFIDTVHTEEQTNRELAAWQSCLSDKAVVCFDDLKRPEMGKFWQNLTQRKIRLDVLHVADELNSDCPDGGFGIAWGF